MFFFLDPFVPLTPFAVPQIPVFDFEAGRELHAFVRAFDLNYLLNEVGIAAVVTLGVKCIAETHGCNLSVLGSAFAGLTGYMLVRNGLGWARVVC